MRPARPQAATDVLGFWHPAVLHRSSFRGTGYFYIPQGALPSSRTSVRIAAGPLTTSRQLALVKDERELNQAATRKARIATQCAPGCPPPPRRRGPSCPSAMLRRTWHLPFAQARLSQPWGRARAAFALAQRVAVSPPDGGLHRRQGGDYPQALRRPLTPHACQGFPPRAPQEHAAGKPVARHGGSDAAKGRAWAHRQPATRRG